MKGSGRPASPLPVCPLGTAEAEGNAGGAGKGSRSPDTRLGPSDPRLPPVAPHCQHCASGEFISSCLEDTCCLDQNYLSGQSALLSDALLVGIFPMHCEVSWASVIYSSFCLWYPALEIAFFFHSSVAHPVAVMIHPNGEGKN